MLHEHLFAHAVHCFRRFGGNSATRRGVGPSFLISLLGGASEPSWIRFCDDAFGDSLFFRGLAGNVRRQYFGGDGLHRRCDARKDRSKGMGLIGAAFGLGFILGTRYRWCFRRGGIATWLCASARRQFSGRYRISHLFSELCVRVFLFAREPLAESDAGGGPKSRPLAANCRKFWTRDSRGVDDPLFLQYVRARPSGSRSFSLRARSLRLAVHNREFRLRLHRNHDGVHAGFLNSPIAAEVGRIQDDELSASLRWALDSAAVACADANIVLLALGVKGLAIGYGVSTQSITGSISLCSGKDEQGNSLGVAQSLASLARILGPCVRLSIKPYRFALRSGFRRRSLCWDCSWHFSCARA